MNLFDTGRRLPRRQLPFWKSSSSFSRVYFFAAHGISLLLLLSFPSYLHSLLHSPKPLFFLLGFLFLLLFVVCHVIFVILCKSNPGYVRDHFPEQTYDPFRVDDTPNASGDEEERVPMLASQSSSMSPPLTQGSENSSAPDATSTSSLNVGSSEGGCLNSHSISSSNSASATLQPPNFPLSILDSVPLHALTPVVEEQPRPVSMYAMVNSSASGSAGSTGSGSASVGASLVPASSGVGSSSGTGPTTLTGSFHKHHLSHFRSPSDASDASFHGGLSGSDEPPAPVRHRNLRPDRRYCFRCRRVIPMRARHCKRCDECILCFDHHCFFLGVCIGEKNHRVFWTFVFLESLLVIAALVLTVLSFRESRSGELASWARLNWPFVLVILNLVPFGILVLGLCVLHSYLAVTNQTTYETLRFDQLWYTQGIPDHVVPFDGGCAHNLGMFCWSKNSASGPIAWKIINTRAEDGFNWFRNRFYECC